MDSLHDTVTANPPAAIRIHGQSHGLDSVLAPLEMRLVFQREMLAFWLNSLTAAS